MNRLFKRHLKRKVTGLNGLWLFKTDPDRRGLEEGWFRSMPEDSTSVMVPSCWNTLPEFRNFQGKAWFSTTFFNTGRNVNLTFHAVTGQAEVYVDGRHIGSHYGSFTGFCLTVADLTPGRHILTVSADNTLNTIDTFPLASVDWFNYGGIIRDVELSEFDDVFASGCKVDYDLDIAGRTAVASFRIMLGTADKREYNDRLKVYLDERLIHECPVRVCGPTGVVVDGILLENLCLWETERPYLYNVRVETDNDDLIERIGFREIKTEDGHIWLNGREIFLKGVNRHEDHPDWGFAIPAAIMHKDVKIIKSMGCNAVRGSHYPNSQLFLDLCDEEGLLFWEEIPMWQYFKEQLDNPQVKVRGIKMLEEMVLRDYNHPSVIIWGMHNEIDVRIPPAYDITAAFAERVRELDPRRLLTYACSYPMEDICFPLADLICINKYFGWYEGVMEDWAAFLMKFKEKLRKDGLGNKPLIISEFGVEAIYGVSSLEAAKWSEDYQEAYIGYVLALLAGDPGISGAFIWQFCDTLSADYTDRSLLRPRGYNNKGIVNEYRKPKKAFRAAMEIYKSERG